MRHPTKTDSFLVLRNAGFRVGTVIDVGVQSCTAELLSTFPDVFHLLIEPVSEWNERMREIYGKKNIRFEIENIAICASDGIGTLEIEGFIPGNPLSHARLISGSPDPEKTSRLVQTSTLDNLVASKSLTPPFLLKIDVDGLEGQVIDGAKKTLNACHLVVVEATVAGITEIIGKMTEAGFVIYDIVDILYYDSLLMQVDLIFIRGSLFAVLGQGKYSSGLSYEGYVNYSKYIMSLKSAQKS